MSVLYLLLGISLLVSVVFFVAFIVAVKNGQYNDSNTPAHRILFDNKPEKNTLKSKN